MKTLKDKMNELPKARQAKVRARAKELMEEEYSLQALRALQKKTQKQVAKQLGITQDNVSRLENRSDILLSTLRHYIEAIGGELDIQVKLPDKKSVKLDTIFGLTTEKSSKKRNVA